MICRESFPSAAYSFSFSGKGETKYSNAIGHAVDRLGNSVTRYVFEKRPNIWPWVKKVLPRVMHYSMV
jgi:hypothetical protein